ncbi:3-dehydro-L-gulonate 2-dehydrogenase [Hymenobacter sp. PAMC 26628]|uniref:3-dehydro-L-gulonate 2-dehydrogenase n=1 Tax=Hymenobacter sp. PAMC 26628 TaxID=1484118 RepID=UPI0007706A96|nr:3-dehydro-L-gulonate 2-dehydrogenase [Hymenobacter sp. PAMC 26628]AMJ64570.1 2,3-diketo-L-gulonate reductase [Hymenobacter sp. PAMC 26628]
MRIPYQQFQQEFKRVLMTLDFPEAKAGQCATLFAENSRDGVYTHGLNRFPTFVGHVKASLVHPAEPELVETNGLVERWDGHLGPGPTNAATGMARAIALAGQHGLGCVALRNANHWMRGGTYGWQAAEAGCIGLCFTNTIANVTPWGGTDARLGNNPLVLAVPRAAGHLVLDMALSQYSFGKVSTYAAAHEALPVPGGYDQAGNLTTDAAEIMASQRGVPIGFWKGSGLALMLDVVLTALSGGRSTADITRSGQESGVSQCFICIRQPALHESVIEEMLRFTKSSPLGPGSAGIFYPGEQSLATRTANLAQGTPVNEAIWEQVLRM